MVGDYTFEVVLPDDYCDNVPLRIRAYGTTTCQPNPPDQSGGPYTDFVLAEGTLVAGYQVEPAPVCVGDWELDGCLSEDAVADDGSMNDQVTFCWQDLFEGGDANCGELRPFKVERRDPITNAWITDDNCAVFTCADIGPHELRLTVGDGEHPYYDENFGYCTTWVEIEDCTAPDICARLFADGPGNTDGYTELEVNSLCEAVLPDYTDDSVFFDDYSCVSPEDPPVEVPFFSAENLSDNCTDWNNLVVTQTPIAGTVFADLGDCPDSGTWVEIEVCDEWDNCSQFQFWVEFVDTTGPAVDPGSCPDNVTIEEEGNCHAVITITAPTGSDYCSDVTVHHDQLVGVLPITSGTPGNVRLYDNEDGTYTGSFPVGTTEVQWWLEDACGNESEHCTQVITVQDLTDPVISCGPDLPEPTDDPIYNWPGWCSAYVSIMPPCWSDNCAVKSVEYEGSTLLPTGETVPYDWWYYVYSPGNEPDCEEMGPVLVEFPVGVTTLTWTVTDMSDNVGATCTQTVTVLDNQRPHFDFCEYWYDNYPGPWSGPMPHDIIDITNPPCDSVLPEEIIDQIEEHNYGWWIPELIDAGDNCPGVELILIETQQLDPGDPSSVLPVWSDPEDQFSVTERTDPYPLGNHFIILVARDTSGNIGGHWFAGQQWLTWCLVEISVIPGDCDNPPTTGACCYDNIGCSITTQAACDASFGTFLGVDTVCADCPEPPPPPTGACCFANWSCWFTSEEGCGKLGGTFFGVDTDCDACHAPPQPPPPSPTGNATPKTEGNTTNGPPVVDLIPVCNNVCGCGMVQTLSLLFVGLVSLRFGLRRRR